jgi:hypothetical protein
MGIIRRWVTLFVLPLLIVSGLTVSVTGSAAAAPASQPKQANHTSPAPVQMNYACALLLEWAQAAG